MSGFIFTICFIVSIMILGAMIREEKTPLLRLILIGNVLVALWLLCDAIPYWIKDEETVLSVYYIKMIAVILFTPIVYMFTVEYTGYLSKNIFLRYSVLIIPTILFISMFTNSIPFSFIEDLSVSFNKEFPVYTYHPKQGFYLYVSYSVFIAVESIILLVIKAIRTPRSIRTQSIRIAISLIICLSASGFSLHLLSTNDFWRGDITDVTSIFLFSFIIVIYIITQKTTMTHKDSIMQVEMNNGLRNNEFRLFLQPQYGWNGREFELLGAEGLIRWFRNGEILYNPDQFIPVAERTEMILPIGNFVIDEVFRINSELQRKGINIKLSINVSNVQLENLVFIEHLSKKWYENKAKGIPINLVIEITESIMLKEKEETIRILNKIKEMGISLALDDFGTGYSSLSYIQELPLDYLKVDKSFVDDMMVNESNLTKHILDIAKTLGLKTVVEGTENFEQVNALTGQCDLFQGYYFSKPVSVKELIKVGNSECL